MESSAASCQAQGKPQLYGLGIRIAFYLQWSGAVVAEYLEVTDLPDIRLLGLLLSAAAFLGIILHLSLATPAPQPVDVYIVFLLAVGFYLLRVPLYAWKALTRCNPHWDPFRWLRVPSSPAFKWLDFFLLFALAAFGTWYWTTFVVGHRCADEQVGFVFSPVPLGDTVHIAFNAILYILILIVCTGILLFNAGWDIRFWGVRPRRRRTRRAHVVMVHDLTTFSNVAVAAVVVAAVEVTIVWNDITGVNDLTDVAQLIPLFLSAGIVIRTIFMHFVRAQAGSDSSSMSSGGGGLGSRRSGMAEPRRPPGGSGFVPPPPPPPPAHMG